MKTPVWMLLILAVPSSIPAQCPTEIVGFEEWETYCDAGVQRVRFTLHLSILGFTALPVDLETEIAGIDSNDPGTIYVISAFDRIETIAPGQFEFIEESWHAAHFPSRIAKREGLISWTCNGIRNGWISMRFTDGPFVIEEGEPCVPNPVAAATWGAVKALYR